jgi:carboxymethylenebutenolidase
MCFDHDARPPLPPIRGSAMDAPDLTLTSADGTEFAAYTAVPDSPSGAGVVIIPDVRGLHPYYEELTLRFAEAGVHAVAIDLYARTAGSGKRAQGFEYEPHVLQLDAATANDDVAAAAAVVRDSVERIYTIGFCLGGRISLLQAAAGLDLSGVIGLYPWPVGPHRSGLPAPADEAPRFACPVLAIYGGADAGIPAGSARHSIVRSTAPASSIAPWSTKRPRTPSSTATRPTTPMRARPPGTRSCTSRASRARQRDARRDRRAGRVGCRGLRRRRPFAPAMQTARPTGASGGGRGPPPPRRRRAS